MKQVAGPRHRNRGVPHWTMPLAVLALIGVGAFAFGMPPLLNTRAAGSSASIGSATYLAAGEKSSVWLVVGVSESGLSDTEFSKTVLYKTSSARLQWTKVLEVPSKGSIRRLWFFGSGRVSAWLGSDFGPPTPSLIMRTADGGARWDSSPAPGDEAVIGVSFVTSAEGWDLVSTGVATHNQGCVLYRTRDGGGHWTEIARVIPFQPSPSGLRSDEKTGVEFRDADNGWIGTESIASMGYLYVSRDGGITWTQQSLRPPAGMSDNFIRVLPPKCFGNRAGVAVAQLPRGTLAVPFVYQTSDGGRSWGDPRGLPIQGLGDSLAWDFLSPAIWAAASDRTLWLSSDAGRTWSQHSAPFPPPYKIDRVTFTGPTRVWLIGSAVRPDGGVPIADYVLETPDLGLHWERAALPQVR